MKARLVGYSDSDFSGDEQDRKSTSGQVFFLGDMLISWASQKQKTVALSLCEAEYVAATAGVCQGMWLNRLVSELSGIDETMVKMLVDNKSAIVLTKNPVQHSRTKHITPVITSCGSMWKTRRFRWTMLRLRISWLTSSLNHLDE